MEPIRKLFNDLENEISSEKFIKLYETIREKYPSIKFCFAPKDLINYLHNQNNPDYQLNDEILSDLVLEYQSHPESKSIGSYFLILFKPGLFKIFSQFKLRAKQFASIEELDLWLQIVTLFFEELSQIDLNKDKIKIASKILGRVRNKLRDYFRDMFKTFSLESELRNDPELNFSVSNNTNAEETEALLQDLVNIGIISETDKYILLATKVYSKSMKELSYELKGISYENIRQRKARAVERIRRYMLKGHRFIKERI